MKIVNNKIWLYQGETAAPTCNMYTADGAPLVFPSQDSAGHDLSYTFAFTVKEDKFTQDVTFQLTGNMVLKTFADTEPTAYDGTLEQSQGEYVVPSGLLEDVLYYDNNKTYFYIENDEVKLYESSITIDLPYSITHNLDAKRYYYEIVVYGKYAGGTQIATKTMVIEPLDFTIIGSLSK